MAQSILSPDEEDDSKKNTLKHFVFTQLDKFFVNHIPIDSFKDLPALYMYYFGTVAYCATIALFIYFTYDTYNAAVNKAYISVESNNGGDKCNTVSISITGTYYADYNGYWEGSPQFVYSYSPYEVVFSNFQVNSDAQYKDMIKSFEANLNKAGEVAATQNLALNLIYWMNYIDFYYVADPSLQNYTATGRGQLQYLDMMGDPNQVFDQSYIQAHVMSRSGFCTVTSYATFDQANVDLTTQLNFTQLVQDEICAEGINPLCFGYYGPVDDGIFQLSMDMNTFSTAMAVNLGIVQISNLGQASATFLDIQVGNVTFLAGKYFDVRFPNMDTIFCLHNVTAYPENVDGTVHDVEQLCFYEFGQTLALPVFNHYGTSDEDPIYCECGVNGNSEDCNVFDLMSGLVYFNTPYDPDPDVNAIKVIINTGLYQLMEVVSRFKSYKDFNRAAYNISFAASAPAYGLESPTVQSQAWRNSSFDFCTVNGQSCSILVYNTYDQLSQKVTDYKFQLTNGSCVNSLSTTQEAWNNMMVPPVQLTQSYYECYPSSYNALFAAFGIASGNTSLAVPLIVTMMLPLLYLLLVSIDQVPPKEEYADPDKAQVIEMLSILLLRLRDGKTRGVKRNGLLVRLTKELISAAKEEGGYPDSDDEDDEEEWIDPAVLAAAKRKSRRLASMTSAGAAGGGDVTDPGAGTTSGAAAAGVSKKRASALNGGRKISSKRMSTSADSDDEEGYDDSEDPVAELRSSLSGNRGHNGGEDGYGDVEEGSGRAMVAPKKRSIHYETSGGGAGGAKVKQRTKMSVFTRQLEDKKDSRITSKRTSAVNSTPSPTSINNNNTHSSTNPVVVATPVTEQRRQSASSSASMFTSAYSYMFGSSAAGGTAANEPAKREQEMTSVTMTTDANPLSLSHYLDASGRIPNDIRVLNSEAFGVTTTHIKYAKDIVGDSIDGLLGDLTRLLNEALALRDRRFSNHQNTSDEEEEDEEAYLGVYAQGKQLSVKLAKVSLAELLDRIDQTVFIQLSTALSIHACLQFNCDMRDISDSTVAYNIGGKVVSLHQLSNLT